MSDVIKADVNRGDIGHNIPVKSDVGKLKVFLPKNGTKPRQNRIRHYKPVFHHFIDADDGDKDYDPRIWLLGSEFSGEKKLKDIFYANKNINQRVTGWFRKKFT